MKAKKNMFPERTTFIVVKIWFILVFMLFCFNCVDSPNTDKLNSNQNNSKKAWKFVVYGDTAANDANHRKVLEAIMSDTPDYKFIINTGDVVADGESINDWETWQKACDDILGGTGQNDYPPKYLAAPGNHDKVHTSQGLANWINFIPGQARYFGNNGIFFCFDYENVEFIILDSNDFTDFGLGFQYDMLMEAIQNNSKEWLFVFWHHPIFDFGPKEYRDDIHDAWGIPLYHNACDMIFVGHAHFYVRTFRIALNGTINPPIDDQDGTVQIISGNGGIGLSTLDQDKDGNGYLIDSCQDDFHGYCEILVDNDQVRLRHMLSDGTVFDEKFYKHSNKIRPAIR